METSASPIIFFGNVSVENNVSGSNVFVENRVAMRLDNISYIRLDIRKIKKCEYYSPVNTRRRFSFYKTSIRRWRRRTEVLQTLKRRRVSTGSSHRNLDKPNRKLKTTNQYF